MSGRSALRFRRSAHSFAAAHPAAVAAVVELGTLVVLFAAYNIIRAGYGGDAVTALAHAHRVVGWEGGAVHAFELRLNAWLLTVPLVAVPTCYFYALMHYAMTPIVLLASRHRGGRQYWRGYWALVAASAVALVVYASFPTAPPRLVPDLGAVDVMRHFADYGWWGDAASAPRGLGDATDQYAAMPSLHFGWALWCGIQLWGLGGAWRRTIAVAYPSLQVFAVISTANHFLVDVVAGGVCVVLAYALVETASRLLIGSRRRERLLPASDAII